MTLKPIDQITKKGPLSEIDKKVLVTSADMFSNAILKLKDIKNYEDMEKVLEEIDAKIEAIEDVYDGDEFKGAHLLV